jgi:hypothetical protein
MQSLCQPRRPCGDVRFQLLDSSRSEVRCSFVNTGIAFLNLTPSVGENGIMIAAQDRKIVAAAIQKSANLKATLPAESGNAAAI